LSRKPRNGEEACSAVPQRSFDLVLLDINMPGAGGIEACRRIRDSVPQVGIVMITVRDSESDKVDALEAGGRRLRHQAVPAERADRPAACGSAPHPRKEYGSSLL
jgi:CheY-like chemotaxis protein